MPPKRKRTDDISAAEGSSSTRATRSTTRQSNGKPPAASVTAKAATTSKSSRVEGGEEGGSESTPPAKKSKTKSAAKTVTSVPKSRGKQATAKAAASSTKVADESGALNPTSLDEEPELPKPSKVEALPPATVPPTPPKPVAPTTAQQSLPPPTSESYTPQRSLALFTKYADPDEPNVIGPEGFESLCTDANFPLDGPLPLILAWQLDAKEMGKIMKDEWISGTDSIKTSSPYTLALAMRDLESLLILKKQPQKRSTKKEPYDKTKYWTYCENTTAAFQKLYMFCFTLAKPEQSRNIEMETAVALWSVLLVPRYPLMGEVLGFINERGSYKATNKDLWSMMLEFCETVNPNLSDYEGDGAWPTLLDDFVIWKKGPNANCSGEVGAE